MARGNKEYKKNFMKKLEKIIKLKTKYKNNGELSPIFILHNS